MEGKVFSSMNRVNSSQSHRSVGESGPISTAMGTCYRPAATGVLDSRRSDRRCSGRWHRMTGRRWKRWEAYSQPSSNVL